jgi:hypothetical protein
LLSLPVLCVFILSLQPPCWPQHTKVILALAPLLPLVLLPDTLLLPFQVMGLHQPTPSHTPSEWFSDYSEVGSSLTFALPCLSLTIALTMSHLPAQLPSLSLLE